MKGRLRRGNIHNASVTSIEGSTLDAVPEAECLDVSNSRSKDYGSPLAARPRSSELNVIAIEKDGQTYWIPEDIFRRFSATQSRETMARPPITPKPESGSHRKPDMKIRIPGLQDAVQSPTDFVGSSPSSAGRLSPPHSLPSSATSSQHSRSTSRTSSEILTPTDTQFKLNLTPADYSSTADAVTEGAYEQSSKIESIKTSILFQAPRVESLDSTRTQTSKSERILPKYLIDPPKSIESPTDLSRAIDKSRKGSRVMSNSLINTAPAKKSRARLWSRHLSFRGKSRKRQPDISNPQISQQPAIPLLPELNPNAAYLSDPTIAQKHAGHSSSAKPIAQPETEISPDAAEAVIFRILHSIDSLDDLFAAARINQGFYSVFRRNELSLAKRALHNGCRPAWELREMSPGVIISGLQQQGSNYTARTYLQFVSRDKYILSALKVVILKRCRSWLRAETVQDLSAQDPSRASGVDNALWRVWTFCTIFGANTGRDQDLKGQLDWLRGGQVAKRSVFSPSTSSAVRDLEITHSILQNPPKNFAGGNPRGLSADELFDMLEMWNSIKTLLSSIQGAHVVRTARQHGVFDGHNVVESDEKRERLILGKLETSSKLRRCVRLRRLQRIG